MTTYSLSPDGLKPFVRNMIVRVLTLYGGLLAVLALVLAILGMLANPTQGLVVLGLALLLFAYTGYRAVRLQLTRLASLRLTLAGDELTRQVAALPDMVIRRAEVTQVEEIAKGLVVRTADRTRFIFAPRGLDGYDDLRSRLAEWRAIEALPAPRKAAMSQSAIMTLIAVCVLAMVIVFNSQDVRLVVPAGIVLAGLLIAAVPTILRSPSYSRGLKRSVWLVAFPLVAIVAKIAMAVSAALGH